MYSFFTLGLFTSSIGALLPLIAIHYSLSDLHVSLIFIAGPLGYILAAQTSSVIHHHFGQFGIALFGPVLQILAATLLFVHPRFEIVLVGFGVQGLGTGLLDGSWCAWAGGMERASTISGFLHGSFSAGAAGGPVFVTLMTANGYAWFQWYCVLVSYVGSNPYVDTADWNHRALLRSLTLYSFALRFGPNQRQYIARRTSPKE